jgi:hypothetical protein
MNPDSLSGRDGEEEIQLPSLELSPVCPFQSPTLSRRNLKKFLPSTLSSQMVLVVVVKL